MTFQLNTSSGPQVAEAFPAAQGARQEPTLDKDAPPSQGGSHPRTGWGNVDTPMNPTCSPLGHGRHPEYQGKPTQTQGECTDFTQTVARASNGCFPRQR